MTALVSPFPQFFDTDGAPLSAGYIFVGEPNDNPETAPKSVFWDAAMTQAAAQPLRTTGGYVVRNGTPAVVYVDTDYSVTVKNRRGEQVYYAASASEFSGASMAMDAIARLASSDSLAGGDAMVMTKLDATGSIDMTQHDLNELQVTLSKFCAFDGSDESLQVQKAIDHCLAVDPPRTLFWDGVVTLPAAAQVFVDRAVDSTTSEFRIVCVNNGGIYTTGAGTVFDSRLGDIESSPGVPDPTAPVSEHLVIEHMRFETSSVFNESYLLSGRFLRIRLSNCFSWCMPIVKTTRYLQQWELVNCTLRNALHPFLECDGLYAVSIMGGRVENAFTLLKNLSTSRGTNGLSIGGGITIEGMQATWLIANGVNGFSMDDYHLESNFSPEINFTGSGAVANKSAHFGPGYIFNPNGETTYYDTAIDRVTSTGVKCSPYALHGRALAVVDLVSINDHCTDGAGATISISDEPWDTEFGGVKIKSATPAARVVNKRVRITYAPVMAIDARLGNWFDVIVTDAVDFAFTAPTNMADGQEITVTIYNTTGSALGVATFNGWQMATWNQPNANSNRSVTGRYNGAKLYEIARTSASIAN